MTSRTFETRSILFGGTLETWEYFIPEFQTDSDTVLVTPEERARAWHHSTNGNESGYARVRALLRVVPNMTELQLKA